MGIEIKQESTYSSIVLIDIEAEHNFQKYKIAIDKLIDAGIISIDIGINALTIIRIKLGLPTVVVNPLIYELDLITLKSD